MTAFSRSSNLARTRVARLSHNALAATSKSAGVYTPFQKSSAWEEQREEPALRKVALKDNICTSDAPTTCASGILQGFQSPYPATVVQKLRSAAVSVLGKTNMDEFGMGSDSVHSIHGPVQSLFSRDSEALSAGGSSGGSAVAVAEGDCQEALGTDTGGSVRLPASYLGIVGFKPSYGLVSRYGVVAYANSLDTVGVLARSTDSAKNIFDVIKGYDSQDPTSIRSNWGPKAQVERQSDWSRSQLRIGVPIEYNTAELEPAVRRAWILVIKALQEQGHTVKPVSLPTTKQALSAYYVLAPAEASSNLAKYDGARYGSATSDAIRDNDPLYSTTRGNLLGEEAKRRILLGSYSLSAAAYNNFFIKAQQVRRLVQFDFNRVFNQRHPLLRNEQQDQSSPDSKVDILIVPTAQSLPPKLKDTQGKDPTLQYSSDVLTVPASLAGLPAISVPVSYPKGRDWDIHDVPSVGIQVIAQYGEDETVFAAAKVIEALELGGVS